jgi:hypothetical protein
MSKAMLKMLERAYEAEIESALTKVSDLIQPKNKKLADELVADGYLEEGQYTIPGRFPVTIKGYRLTHLGRITYCSTCEGEG